MDLVEIKNGDIVCDSQIVAQNFNQKPARIKKLIRDIITDLGVHECTPNFNPKYIIENREYRGQKYTAYLMNRDFFSLLAMRFKGKKAVAWQIKYIAKFNGMENQLLLEKTNAGDPKWVGSRKLLIEGRKKETDVIKEFVEYATKQGSTRAKFYYKHITNATYKALDLMNQKKPKLRDTMNIYEISELLLAEKVAQEALKKYMALKRDYHDIYDSVKHDLILFSNRLRIT